MDLPGLHSGSEKTSVERINLNAKTEWRFEVGGDGVAGLGTNHVPLTVKLLSGTAELFGTELVIGAEYRFAGSKAAIYTWHGCELQFNADATELSEYVSDDTPMSVYANLHFALEQQRQQHQQNGPNVLVLGPPDSGKSSLCKILCAYANKMSRFPMLVNLDPAEGVFAAPGSLTAAPISDILDVEQGWGHSQTNGPALLHPKQPLCYYYGLESVAVSAKYYKAVSNRLAVGVAARMAKDHVVAASGMIIDTPGDLDRDWDTLNSLVADFNVTCIVVVNKERLFSDLTKRFKARPGLTILKVAKSGGCVDRDPAYMRTVQARAIREYFYGSSLRQTFLAPYTVTVDYSLITVYRVAETKDLAGSSVLPADIGGEPVAESDQPALVTLEASAILQNCILAVLNAAREDAPEVLVAAEVLGFVHVVEADDTKHKMKVLIPVPGRLPSRPFLMGEYRYVE